MRSLQNGSNRPRALTRSLTALLLAALLLIGGSALADDLSDPCEFTVTIGGDADFAADVLKTKAAVTLYKVAGVGMSGGRYVYTPLPNYPGLSIPDDLDADGLDDLAQRVVTTALNGDTPLVTDAAFDTSISATPGLYLLTVSGKNVDTETIRDESGREKIVMAAHADEYDYIFEPRLVSLPTDKPIPLKSQRLVRYASLEIQKTLTTFAPPDEASFIFSIEAVKDGVTVYSDVVTFVFSASGQKSMTVDRIPAGATVTVTEIYSGAHYTITSSPSLTMVVNAGVPNVFPFTNDYTPSVPSGGSIVNTFSYDSAKGGWIWEKTDGSSAPVKEG